MHIYVTGNDGRRSRDAESSPDKRGSPARRQGWLPQRTRLQRRADGDLEGVPRKAGTAGDSAPPRHRQSAPAQHSPWARGWGPRDQRGDRRAVARGEAPRLDTWPDRRRRVRTCRLRADRGGGVPARRWAAPRHRRRLREGPRARPAVRGEQRRRKHPTGREESRRAHAQGRPRALRREGAGWRYGRAHPCRRYGAQVVLLQLRSARSIEGARRAQAVKGGRAPARGARGRSPQVRSRLNLARRWGLLSGVVIRSFLAVTIALVAAVSGDRGVALPGPAAVVERGGVILRLELDRGAIAPGELLWATLTVSNTNDHDLRWTAGGCRILGLVEALPLLPDAGRPWPGALGTFKTWALQYPESYAYFADETIWPHRGGACPAAQFTEILPAGGTRRSRWVWDGYTSNAASGSRAAPGGQMEIVASFFL